MKKRRLIINGDEFGLSDSVDKGILEAHKKGLLSSTTAIPTGESFAANAAQCRKYPALGVGIHLMLTDGIPAAPAEEVHTLLGPDGGMFRRAEFLKLLFKGKIPIAQIETEFRGQIERFKSSGLPLSHFDSHQSTYIVPRIFKIVLRLAAQEHVPIRLPFDPLGTSLRLALRAGGGHFIKQLAKYPLRSLLRRWMRQAGIRSAGHFRTFYSFYQRDTRDIGTAFKRMLDTIPPGTCEIMTHPGYMDDTLCHWVDGGAENASLRERELRALTDPEIKRFAAAANTELINYTQL